MTIKICVHHAGLLKRRRGYESCKGNSHSGTDKEMGYLIQKYLLKLTAIIEHTIKLQGPLRTLIHTLDCIRLEHALSVVGLL